MTDHSVFRAFRGSTTSPVLCVVVLAKENCSVNRELREIRESDVDLVLGDLFDFDIRISGQ